jgi:tRNA threonylcarbamoyladenosine biosynthesis protein TsaB
VALILNIDTATEIASACLCREDTCLASLENPNQKEHASFVHMAIQELLQQTGYSLQQLDAIAVTAGPGSYTGLRVGLATAKGLCYSLNKPLVTASTLKVMAVAALQQVQEVDEETLLCPMIDARRMEVFSVLYNRELEEVMPATSLILDEASFDRYLTNKKIIFFGSGSTKYQPLIKHTNALFAPVRHSASHLGTLAWQAFQKSEFVGIAYAEPMYLKEFYSTAAKSKY